MRPGGIDSMSYEPPEISDFGSLRELTAKKIVNVLPANTSSGNSDPWNLQHHHGAQTGSGWRGKNVSGVIQTTHSCPRPSLPRSTARHSPPDPAPPCGWLTASA